MVNVTVTRLLCTPPGPSIVSYFTTMSRYASSLLAEALSTVTATPSASPDRTNDPSIFTSANSCSSSAFALHAISRRSAANGANTAARSAGGGSVEPSRRSTVVFAMVCSRSLRASMSVTEYWSRSRNASAVSAVSTVGVPSTSIGPVNCISAAIDFVSSRNTPSIALPPLCGYNWAIASATAGKCGAMVMLLHTCVAVVPPGPEFRPNLPHCPTSSTSPFTRRSAYSPLPFTSSLRP